MIGGLFVIVILPPRLLITFLENLDSQILITVLYVDEGAELNGLPLDLK